MKRLVCVSNRIALPRRGTAAGGLAVGLMSALRQAGGTWFGWSGEVAEEPAAQPQLLSRDGIQFATIDLNPHDLELYYNGYCNSTLWPLFHYFPERFRHEPRQYEAYQSVNALFARQLKSLLARDDAVWIHDYHLIPLARHLRLLKFTGPIGFFLHIPFPHIQMLRLLPNHAELIRELCQYDLVGFQTEDDVLSFRSCIEQTASDTWQLQGDGVEVDGRRMRMGAYPIGVDVTEIANEASAALAEEPVRRMIASLNDRKLIIGVDRLDYSKGLTQRFNAFEEFLETFPDNQGHVTFLQIAPLSRADVLAYSEIRKALEQTAGKAERPIRRGGLDAHPVSQPQLLAFDSHGLSSGREGGAGHAHSRRHEPRGERIRCRAGPAGSRGAGALAHGRRCTRAYGSSSSESLRQAGNGPRASDGAAHVTR